MPQQNANSSTGIFVAVGHHGLRLMSADGTTWSPLQIGKEGDVYRALIHGNGRFVAVGSYGGSNLLAVSQDGIVWDTQLKDAQYVNFLRGIGFGKQQFIGLGGDPGAVGDSRPFVLTSTDGKTWSDAIPNNVTQSLLLEQLPAGSKAPASSKNMLRRIAYGNERFVAVGDRGRRSVTFDARQWTDTPDVKAIDTLIDIAFGQGVFVGVGLHGLRVSSEDGIRWSAPQRGEEGEHLNSVIWTGDQFVAVGQGATYSSKNGRDWQRTPNSNAPLIAVYGHDIFVGSNWRGKLLKSNDAIDWSLVHQAEHHIEAIAFG